MAFWAIFGAATLTPASGWTTKGATAPHGSQFQQMDWRRLSGDGGSWSWTATAGVEMHLLLVCYRGATPTGDPFSFFSSGVSGSGTTFPAVSGTTLRPHERLVWGANGWSAAAYTPPTGFSNLQAVDSLVIQTADMDQAAVGSTGSLTGSTSVSTSSDAMLVGLMPPAAPAGAACGGRMLLGMGC
jgi:hypothetical protein